MSTQVEISKRLVLINSSSSVAARLISISVLVWLHQYLLRRISPDEYSLYPVLMAVMVFVPLLTTILTSGLGRYIVEADVKGDEWRVTQIVSTMFPLLMGAGALFLALGWTFAWHVDHILTIAPGRLWDARIMLVLLMFSAAIRLTLAPFGVGMYVRQKFVLLNCIKVCTELLRIALLLLLLLGVSTRVLWVVVASVSANLCGLLVAVAISRRLIPALRFQISAIDWKSSKNLISFGAWNTAIQLQQMIRSAIDPILLNKLSTPLDVTCFHLGSIPLRQTQMITGIAVGPVQPALTALYSKSDTRRLQKAYLRIGKYALWFGTFLVFPIIIYAKELIALYVGNKYIESASVMLLMTSIIPLGYGNVMMSRLAHAHAEMRPVAIRVIIEQVGKILLAVYMVAWLKLGAFGAALSSFLVAILSHCVLMLPLGLKLAKVTLRTWLRETVWPGFLPGLCATGVWLSLKVAFSHNAWFNLGLSTVFGWLIYIVVLLVFCLQQDEKNMIISHLRNIRRKLGSFPLHLRSGSTTE